MKVKKERNLLEMKSELDILNFVGHDYLLSASALQIDDNLFQSQFNILGKIDDDDDDIKATFKFTFDFANLKKKIHQVALSFIHYYCRVN